MAHMLSVKRLIYLQHLPLHNALRSIRADSRFAPSQWETALLCNDVSHWMGTSLESALSIVMYETGLKWDLTVINTTNKRYRWTIVNTTHQYIYKYIHHPLTVSFIVIECCNEFASIRKAIRCLLSRKLWNLSCSDTGDTIVCDRWHQSVSAQKHIIVIMSQCKEIWPGLILGLRSANERRCYKVTPSLIGWAQT